VISENKSRGSRFVARKSRQDQSRSCFKVVTCFAIEENEYRDQKRKPSNANNTLFIYTSSATLEAFLMLRCTIRLLSHDLTHHQSISLSTQPRHIVQHRNTSVHFLIILNYPATTSPLSPHLPTSLSFRNKFLQPYQKPPSIIPKYCRIF
jgi:hypothetical protein